LFVNPFAEVSKVRGYALVRFYRLLKNVVLPVQGITQLIDCLCFLWKSWVRPCKRW